MVSSEHTGELKAVFWLFRLLFGPSSVIKSCFTNSLSFPPHLFLLLPGAPSQFSLSWETFHPRRLSSGISPFSSALFPPLLFLLLPSLHPFLGVGFQSGRLGIRLLGVSEALWRGGIAGGGRGGGMKVGRRKGDRVSHLQRSLLSASPPSSSSPQQPGDRVAEPGRKTCNPPSSPPSPSMRPASVQINKGSKWELSAQRDDSSPPSLQRDFMSSS